jgi:transcriptional regulator NrdR family protein
MSIRKCDKCGERMRVKQTWHTKDGYVRRLRVCQKCKRRLATIER